MTAANNEALDQAENMAHRAAEKAKEVAGDLSLQGRVAMLDAQDAAVQAHDSVADTIRRNPTASVLGAAGVGLLIGLALRSRS